MNEIQTPAWVKDAIFYQIFPDRFAKSDSVQKPARLEPWDAPATPCGFKGGDLAGVTERLDYLLDLGVNAIYINPIFASASNHRYHTHDYYHVDPLLGGDEAFFNLLDKAHRRGIRVVLDGVFNHASRGFFQFNHILECGQDSPYLDWFDVKDFPLNPYGGEPNYRCWVGNPALPEFNIKNPEVRRFIFDVARYWIDKGIDGWRLDVPYCIDDDSFWQEFRQVVKSANPEAYLVGEIAWEAQRWLKGDQFDAVMNYQFTWACLGFFGGDKVDRDLERGKMGLPPSTPMDAPAFDRRVQELLTLYPHEIALSQLNLLDSHDMPRFVSLVGGDHSALHLAVLFQMTYPGAPCIYYGDEIGMKNGPTQADEHSRWAFPWDQVDTWDVFTREVYRRLISIRKFHPALRTGEFIPLFAEGSVYAYARRAPDDLLFIILNNSSSSYHLDIPVNGLAPEGAHLISRLGQGAARVVDGKITRLAVAPKEGAILQL